MPERKRSGHRLYPVASVEQLRRVARLLGHGHRPGELLPLTTRELDKLLSLAEPSSLVSTLYSRSGEPGGEGLERSMAVMMRAAKDLDREALVGELRAYWIRMGPLEFLQHLAGPFMNAIGRAWKEQGLAVRHEHFAFACLTDFLREAREPYDHVARGPRVVAAMLPGDHHDGGLLMACAILAIRGCRILYLGADTPVDQIAAAAASGPADAVAVSISAAAPRARAAKDLALLREALPGRMPLWVGGSGSPDPPKGVEHFDNLAGFDARLATWI
jgi:methylmalonyl-CoA mutase cobalamin-binding subunit